MQIKLTRIEDLRFYEYISEIDRAEQVLRKRPDLTCKNRILNELEEQRMMIEKYSIDGEDYEVDSLWESYNELESEKIDEYYNEMASLYKSLYAIFENQTAKERKLNYSRYPKIQEMNWVVNVLKHSKGPSYQKLVDIDSKFIKEPVEFQGILPGTTAREILNLEYQDLIDFCNQARVAWMERLEEEQAEYLASKEEKATETTSEEESAK